ncbi:hypothetical protein Leryth_018513, partial [Lithospermum erythrorhizon]
CLDKAAIISDAERKTGDYSEFPIWATGIVFSAVDSQMSTMLSSVWIPFYDRVLVPIARNLTGQEGDCLSYNVLGLVSSFQSLIILLLLLWLEIKVYSFESLIVHKAVAVPLSIFWKIPQFALLGVAESPDAMRSLSSVLNLIIVAFGNFSSSIILTIVTTITTRGGNAGWIPDNLNEGHLDYFFWLLAGLSLVNLLIYVVCAKHYKLKKAFVRFHNAYC